MQNPNWRNQAAGWNLPPFARLEEAPAGSGGVGTVVVVEGPAEGAIAQMITRPAELAGAGVMAVGYVRVEVSHPLDPTDDDVTARLWEGTVNLVNGYSKDGRHFESPYARIHLTGREVASGYWKRFVTGPIPAGRARLLYPHFAFWGTRVASGVKLHLAAMSLVEAPAKDGGDPESWVACSNLPAPRLSMESATRRQWEQALAPDGAFDDAFGITARPAPGEPRWREVRLTARYRQGALVADRFLIAVTEDGSDPRLSPTSRVLTVLAQRGMEQWDATMSIRANAKRLAIAVAAAANTADGLKTQPPLLPPAWQNPRL